MVEYPELVEGPELAKYRAQGEDPELGGVQVQVVDQSPHCVLFLVHKQDQLKELEGLELERLRRLFPRQRVLVEEERLVPVVPHRESLQLRDLHK